MKRTNRETVASLLTDLLVAQMRLYDEGTELDQNFLNLIAARNKIRKQILDFVDSLDTAPEDDEKICPKCQGDGFVSVGNGLFDCPVCRGERFVSNEKGDTNGKRTE